MRDRKPVSHMSWTTSPMELSNQRNAAPGGPFTPKWRYNEKTLCVHKNVMSSIFLMCSVHLHSCINLTRFCCQDKEKCEDPLLQRVPAHFFFMCITVLTLQTLLYPGPDPQITTGLVLTEIVLPSLNIS